MGERKDIECVDCGPGIDLESLTDRLVVKDKVATIPGLDAMIEQVIRSRLTSIQKIGDELIRLVKEQYVIKGDEEADYRSALLDLYDRRLIDYL